MKSKFLFLAAVVTLLMAPRAAMAAAGLEEVLDKAHAALAKGNSKAACKSFEKAVELSAGKSYAAYLGLASARIGAGQPREALAAAEAAEKLATDPSSQSAAAFLQGLAQFRLERPSAESLAAAQAALERALALDPEKAFPAKQVLAQVEAARGQGVKAIADLRATIAQLPKEDSKRTQARILLCSLVSRFPTEVTQLDSILPPDDSGVQKPVGLYQPQPHYSNELRAAGVQGIAIFEAVIDRDGCVRQLETLKADDKALEKTARDTVARWVFEPAILNGQPVAVYYSLTMSFRLQ